MRSSDASAAGSRRPARAPGRRRGQHGKREAAAKSPRRSRSATSTCLTSSPSSCSCARASSGRRRRTASSSSSATRTSTPRRRSTARHSSRRRACKGIPNFQLDAKAAPRVCAAGPKVPTVAIDIHQPPCEMVFFGANNFQAGKLAGAALGDVREEDVELQGRRASSRSTRRRRARSSSIARTARSRASSRSARASRSTKVTTNATTDGTIQPFTDTLSRFPAHTSCSSWRRTTTRRSARSRRRRRQAASATSTSARRAATPRRGRRSAARRRSRTGSPTPATSRSSYGDTLVPLLLVT